MIRFPVKATFNQHQRFVRGDASRRTMQGTETARTILRPTTKGRAQSPLFCHHLSEPVAATARKCSQAGMRMAWNTGHWMIGHARRPVRSRSCTFERRSTAVEEWWRRRHTIMTSRHGWAVNQHDEAEALISEWAMTSVSSTRAQLCSSGMKIGKLGPTFHGAEA